MHRSFRFSYRSIPVFVLLLAAVCPHVANALELIMFDKAGCVWCARWQREIGPAYAQTQAGRAAPFRRIDIRDQHRSGIDLGEPVIYTPTFVLSDEGVEVGRITGYQGEEMFWSSLDEMLRDASGGER